MEVSVHVEIMAKAAVAREKAVPGGKVSFRRELRQLLRIEDDLGGV